MKSIKLINKPNKNNPNLKSNNYILVGQLDKRDKEVQEVFKRVESLGSSRAVPLYREKKGKLINHIWDLEGMYSIKVRLDNSTISDSELIVLLKELLDTLKVISDIGVQYIDFDIDRIFITNEGTVAFMIWGIQGKVEDVTIVQTLNNIIDSASPSDHTDQISFATLKEAIPTNAEEYKAFTTMIYTSYAKIVSRIENKEEPVKEKETTHKVEKKGMFTGERPKRQEPREEIKEVKPPQRTGSIFDTLGTSDINIPMEDNDKTTLNVENLDFEDSDKTEMLVSEIETPKEDFYTLLREQTKEVFNLEKGINTLGRSANADIHIKNNKSISGKHLEISVSDSGVLVKDLNSSNGSFIDGSRLRANEPIEISEDTEFKVSDETFILEKTQ